MDERYERHPDATSFHVRRAQALETASVAWLIARFSPLLLVQASYRLRGTLRRVYDPEDLVDEVWLAALPRLEDLKERDGRLGPVLLRFLGTTLLNKANQWIEHALTYRRVGEPPLQSSSTAGVERLQTSFEDACSRAQHDETTGALRAALAELDEEDRELLVLRGIEQLPNESVAQLLGVTPSTATRRYQRALARLRARLPGSIFEELPD
jgi:RNA polymerase sigma-70 factor (ECF subfamily)